MAFGTPLVIGPRETEALKELRQLASEHPVNMREVYDRLKDPVYKAAHMRQMNRQTVTFSFGFMVTFSIETNHPIGTCRHMSVSSPAYGRVPTPEAVNMIAEMLGFVGGHKKCSVWVEELKGGDTRKKAINLIQPLIMNNENNHVH